MATKSKVTTKAKRKPAKRKTPKKAAPRTRGVQPLDCRLDSLPPEAAEVANRIESGGGLVIGSYCEPLGRNPLLLAALPIDSIEPTPFQRDLSDAHHKKLSGVIDRTGLFLDPVIAITAPKEGFWTPNGRHRLEAMRRLGAKAIIALVVPKREIAWQILALNTEKAHNLRERSLEVIRIYRGLIEEDASRPEKDFAFYLEEAALVTLGVCYERKGNFAGGAYHSILRRLSEFSDEPLRKSLTTHERHAKTLFDLDTRDRGSGRETQGARAGEPVPARVRRRTHQSVALDQGRAATVRRGAGDDVRARGPLQCGQDQTAGSCALGRCAGRGMRAGVRVATKKDPKRKQTVPEAAVRRGVSPGELRKLVRGQWSSSFPSPLGLFLCLFCGDSGTAMFTDPGRSRSGTDSAADPQAPAARG